KAGDVAVAGSKDQPAGVIYGDRAVAQEGLEDRNQTGIAAQLPVQVFAGIVLGIEIVGIPDDRSVIIDHRIILVRIFKTEISAVYVEIFCQVGSSVRVCLPDVPALLIVVVLRPDDLGRAVIDAAVEHILVVAVGDLEERGGVINRCAYNVGNQMLVVCALVGQFGQLPGEEAIIADARLLVGAAAGEIDGSPVAIGQEIDVFVPELVYRGPGDLVVVVNDRGDPSDVAANSLRRAAALP